MKLCHPPTLTSVLLFLALILSPWTSAVSGEPGAFYLKGGLGASFSADTDFSDRDCNSSDPAALFGCGTGNNGKSLGSEGDFGTALPLELGAGYQVNEWLRTELLFTYRAGFAYSGTSNFSQIDRTFQQKVDGDVTNFSGMLNAVFDLSPFFNGNCGKLHPLLLGGIGFSYNEIDSMTYQFPTTSTATPDGSTTQFGWNIGAGAAYEFSDRISLELIYRYSDLGRIETDADKMVITRNSDNSVITDSITIDKTRADFSIHEVLFSVVWYF
ncbi:MAG: porin family protein [Desulfobulbaceae bacterium]|nr:MAG: porin family protein [Desulfobulbaceae bacterium]